MKERKDRLDILWITGDPFPIGLASTNRTTSVLTELANHVRVKLIVSRPTDVVPNIRNTEAKGIYRGIPFEYVNGTTRWPAEASKIVKLYVWLKGILLSYWAVVKECPRVVVLTSRCDYFVPGLYLLSGLLGFRLYREISEKPICFRSKIYRRFVHAGFHCFHGVIVMTNELKAYFRFLPSRKIFHLPMSVDLSRFSEQADTEVQRCFMYCGGGNLERDGILDLVRAFSEFGKKTEDYQLHILGPIIDQNAYNRTVLETIRESGISDRILLKGVVRSQEIPRLLSSVTALVMTPPTDFESGGFPTKLGEYLASGVPVICTTVSEIPLYLDSTCAYLVTPGDIEGIADAMSDVVRNREKGREIGKNGRKMAEKYFDVRKYTDELLAFMRLKKS